MLLTKGFEVEVYTGTPDGQVVGLSDRIVSDLSGFVREPDSRNVEYTTAPFCRYERLLCELVQPRVKLRKYLKSLGDYTLIPGSTLSLGGSDRFHRSDPNNPYHDYIEQTYGTSVVTASIHINIGIDDPEVLMRACRLVRVEAPLYLALSASSPFLNSEPTGHHSTRWYTFPKTPAHVPLFESHRHYIEWTEAQLAAGTMQNVRHLWDSVRPNGDRRPYQLNRLELRICDLVTDPISLLAITALLEARIMQAIASPGLDPLQASQLPSTSRAEDLVTLTNDNERAAAHASLNAQMRHWHDGQPISAHDWIQSLYQQVWPTAKSAGIGCFLLPIQRILQQGNEAQQWLKQHEHLASTQAVLQNGIEAMIVQENMLENELCQPLVA
ncbi:MAG: glutamate--cysteine ligase [Elainellaceae cyanobacterium]